MVLETDRRTNDKPRNFGNNRPHRCRPNNRLELSKTRCVRKEIARHRPDYWLTNAGAIWLGCKTRSPRAQCWYVHKVRHRRDRCRTLRPSSNLETISMIWRRDASAPDERVMGGGAERATGRWPTVAAMLTTPDRSCVDGRLVQQLANSDKARPRDDVLFNVDDVG